MVQTEWMGILVFPSMLMRRRGVWWLVIPKVEGVLESDTEALPSVPTVRLWARCINFLSLAFLMHQI